MYNKTRTNRTKYRIQFYNNALDSTIVTQAKHRETTNHKPPRLQAIDISSDISLGGHNKDNMDSIHHITDSITDKTARNPCC